MDHLTVDGARLETRWWRAGRSRPGRAAGRAAPRGPGQRLHLARLPGRGRRRAPAARCSPTAGAATAAPIRAAAAWPSTSCTAKRDEVVPRVLDAAGIDRAVLLGHSDGGSIALLAAARWPDRVAALALEAPHVFVEDLSVASIAAIGERYRRDRRAAAPAGRAPRARRRGVLGLERRLAERRLPRLEHRSRGRRACTCPVLVAAGRRRRVRHHRADRRDRAAVERVR